MVAMIKADETLEKLSAIEKAVNEMATLRQGILELKEAEAARQKALDELRERENRYRILLENLPQQIFIKEKDSGYTFCNRRYAAELMREPEDIIGKTDDDFCTKEVAEKCLSEDERIMTTGLAEDKEESVVQDGRSFTARRIKTPLRGEKGEIIGILGVSWDITEERRREEELRKNCKRLEESVTEITEDLQRKNKLLMVEMADRRQVEDRLQGAEDLRRIIEKIALPIIMMDENEVISLVNVEFEKLFGYSKEEVEGKKCFMDFFGEKDAEGIAEYFATQRVNLDAVMRGEHFRLLDKNGDIRDISLTVSTSPETKKSLAFLMDISETRKTRGRLKEIEEIYYSLLQNVNEGIALVQGGNLKIANPKLLELSGYTKEELTSKPFGEFILSEDRGRFEIQPEKVKNEDPNHAFCIRMVHKDGGVRWLENRETIVQWGKDKAVLHFLTDKTHRKQAEEELRLSLEPFRRLMDTLDKYLIASGRNI
jgi:PAS domain S-box-containing protein